MAEHIRTRRRRRALVLTGVFVVVILGALALIVISTDTIATAIAVDWLGDRGIDCEPAPDIHVAWGLGSARVGPTDCRVTEGPVAGLALPEGAHVTLTALRPRSISAAALALDLRERAAPPAATDWLTRIAGLASARERMQQLVVDAAYLSRREWPGLDLERLTLSTAGERFAEIDQVSIESEPNRLIMRAQNVRLEDAPEVAISETFAEVTPGSAEVSADLDAEITILSVPLRQRLRAVVTATALDTPSPRYRLRFGR